jgi:hypothetical protein
MFLQKYKATFLTHLVVLLFDAVSKDNCFSKFRLFHVKELCTLFVQLFPSFCSGYLTNQCLTFFQGILCSLQESSAYVKGLGFGIMDDLLYCAILHPSLSTFIKECQNYSLKLFWQDHHIHKRTPFWNTVAYVPGNFAPLSKRWCTLLKESNIDLKATGYINQAATGSWFKMALESFRGMLHTLYGICARIEGLFWHLLTSTALLHSNQSTGLFTGHAQREANLSWYSFSYRGGMFAWATRQKSTVVRNGKFAQFDTFHISAQNRPNAPFRSDMVNFAQ